MPRQNREDDTVVLIMLCAGLLVAFVLAKSYFREQWMTAYAWMKIIETYPVGTWFDSWTRLSDSIMAGERNMAAADLDAVARFYNRYITALWLIPFGFMFWKIFRMKTDDIVKGKLSMKGVLEKSVKVFSGAAPWVHRDLTRENYNVGPFRLAESPLQFLIKNRAILDPNGDPFCFSLAYDPTREPVGEDPSLYNDYRKPSEDDEDRLFETNSFREKRLMLRRLAKKPALRRQKTFKRPEIITSGNSEKEMEKFMKSGLIQDENSCYVNTDNKSVINSIDEKRLDALFSDQLGERIPEVEVVAKKMINGKEVEERTMIVDPFAYLRKLGEESPKEAWRYALAVALFLHGTNGGQKKAMKILDDMNYSLQYKGEIDPLKINVKAAFEHKLEYAEDYNYRNHILKHAAFTNTFFVALLRYAKTRGVIISAQFSWTRYLDRTLYYALNQYGRAVYWTEAVGVASHFIAEETVGHKLDEPYVRMAVEGIRDVMIHEGYLNEKNETEASEKRQAEQNQILEDIRRQQESGYKTA